MADIAATASKWRVVFYGQSLVAATVVNSTTEYTMRGRGVPWGSAAVGGLAWSQLDDLAASLLHPTLAKATNVVVVMVGGTTDYASGFPEASVLANMTTVAMDAKAAGDLVTVINTTTTPSVSISGGNETNRLEGNALLLAEAGGAAFDYVVDLAGDPDLDDHTDTNWYSDGTHPTDAGRQRIAELLSVPLDIILAT